MNDIQIGDVFAHRTLTIKTPFTPVPFPATYEVVGVSESRGVHLRALHHYGTPWRKTPQDVDAVRFVFEGSVPFRRRVLTLVTELPDKHGEQFTTNPRTIEKWYVFLRHADGGI